MITGATCPSCGRRLPESVRHGLCPACLMEMARTPLEPLAPGEMIPDPEPGIGLGDYELLEEIARGGMGIVFKARQKSLDRIVAVKMILAGEFASPEFALRFRREAQAAARLRHPHIVSIHEVGEHEGRQFFSMEYIEGTHLGEMAVRFRGAEWESRLVPLLAKIARAVHFAHEQGVLHRDLKPSNILLDDRGEPKITDFGLAKMVAEGAEEDSTTVRVPAGLTLTGQTLGSPNYLPPEQIGTRHGRVGPAGDIYALGAVLYHLLTGRPPFVGDTVHQTLARVEREEPVSPRLLHPAVSRDLETICLKCLEKDPARRYGTALALAEDLERAARGEPILARPVSRGEHLYRMARRHPTRSLLILALAISLLAGLTAVTWLWQRAQETAQRERQERRRAEALLNRLDFDRAESFFAAGHHDRGLASLARAARRHPANRAVTARLVSALTRESNFLPLGPFLEEDAGLNDAIFSPDGRWILTVTENGRAQLWNAGSLTRAGKAMTHHGAIQEAVFHPDSSLLATASADGTARLWHVPEGTPATEPLNHAGPVTGLVFNHDGSILVTACRDGRVRLWQTADGTPAAPPLPHGSPVLDIAYGGATDDWATSCEDGTVRVWRIQGALRELQRFEHPRKVTQIRFAPDGRRLLTVCHDGHLRLWDAIEGRLIFDVPAHAATKSMTAVRFDAAGDKIATCSWDYTARILDARTGGWLNDPLPHEDTPMDAAWLGDGEFLVTGGRDNLVRLWDARRGRLLGAPARHGFLVYAVAVRADAAALLTASKDHTARLLDLRPGRDWPRRTALPDAVTDARGIPGKDVLALATRGGAAMWNPLTGRQPAEALLRSREPLMALAGDRQGHWLAGADLFGTVSLWDLQHRGARNPVLEVRHGEPVNALEISPDGTRLLTSGGTVRLWNLEDGRELHRLRASARFALARLAPDGDRLVSASWDETARVWDAQTGNALTPPLRHSRPVLDAAWSGDGQWIATASRDQTARLWDPGTGQLIGNPLPHRHEVQRVFFSPSNELLATISSDHHVSLWRVPSGAPAVSAPLRHASKILRLAFSPDGHWLATGTESGRVRVWSVLQGLPVTAPIEHDGPVSKVMFLEDGRTLLTASWDGTVRLHDLTIIQAPAPGWLPELAEAVGGLRLTETDVEEVVSARAFLDLKATLRNRTPTNDFIRWAQWFLADRGTRTISYRSTVTVPEFVQQCLRENTTNSLRTALWLAPANREVVTRWRALIGQVQDAE